MEGDKLVIHEGHLKAARRILELLIGQITGTKGKFVVTIAGESGSGKSEIASVLSELLNRKAIRNLILQQDDYFVYPPKTNAEMRRKDIDRVGLSEVRLALLDRNLGEIVEGESEIEKPLVIFAENRVIEDTITLEGIKVVIVEGTYTTALSNVHRHVFIDRTHVDTRETRRRRAREKQDEYLESILEIEHKIISSHKPRADIIVTTNYEVMTGNDARPKRD